MRAFIRTATAYRLAGGDLEDLGREAHGAFDAELLVLGAVDEVAADWHPRQYLRT